MKLDRNIDGNNGRGKYALLKLRKLNEFVDPADPFQQVAPKIVDAIKTLEDAGILDWGDATETEFFVIRLKDKYAQSPLLDYANAAELDGDWEYGKEVRDLAARAGTRNPFCKTPD